MKELVIDRTKWYRGKTPTESRLLRTDGMMCCLGFYSLACGLEPENIIGVSFPSKVDWDYVQDYPNHEPATVPAEMRWLFDSIPDPLYSGGLVTSDVESIIGRVNDNAILTEEEREAKITAHFIAHDVAVTFIN